MKKLILSAALGFATVAAFGQGQVTINSAGANANAKYSNTVAGVWASGNAFYAGLYWAPSNSLGYDSLLTYNGGTLVATGGTNNTGLAIFIATGFVTSGSFGGNRTITEGGNPVTANCYVQLRAWSSVNPANGLPLMSYQQASDAMNPNVLITRPPGWPGVNNPAPIVGVTPQAASTAGVPQIQWAPGSSGAAPLVVGLYPVPEPSTIALAGLGLLGLLFIRRRK